MNKICTEKNILNDCCFTVNTVRECTEWEEGVPEEIRRHGLQITGTREKNVGQ